MTKKVFLQWGVALLTAIVISAAVQGFQISLEHVLDFHGNHPYLVWALPIAWIFFWISALPKGFRDFESTDQILHEIRQPRRKISRWLWPLIWLRTLWSHLFGASVGREGTALQMAGSLSDTAARIVKWDSVERRSLLRASLAAGLSAAYLTPFAGFVFAVELGGETTWQERLQALLASFAAFFVAAWVFGRAPLDLPQIDFAWDLILNFRFALLCLGLILFAPVYRVLLHLLKKIFGRLGSPTRWTLAGCLGLFFLLFWYQTPLRNLGTQIIDLSFSDAPDAFAFLKKTFVTAIFVAGGWFGGDFTPNMAAGAAAGSSFAGWAGFPLPILGAAMGLFLPVAFTHRILATGWVMTLEYFGWKVAVVAAPCFIGAWALHFLWSQRNLRSE